MATMAQKYHQDGVDLFRSGNFEAARQKLTEALTHTPELNQQAEIYNDLGVTHKELGDFPAAIAALNEAMARFTETGHQKGQAQTLGNRAAVLEAAGQPEEAVETYKQSATLFEEIGESELAMYVWQAVSRLRMKQKQYIAAIGAYEEGIQNMPESSFKRKILQQLLKLPGSMLGGGGTDDSKPD